MHTPLFIDLGVAITVVKNEFWETVGDDALFVCAVRSVFRLKQPDTTNTRVKRGTRREPFESVMHTY